MITIEEWKKKRNLFIDKIELSEIPEEEWQDFLDELSPTFDRDLPQSRKIKLTNIAYPTIYDFIRDNEGRKKIHIKIAHSFFIAGFTCNISKMIIHDIYFEIEYSIGAQ